MTVVWKRYSFLLMSLTLSILGLFLWAGFF
jgi:hypothetical protein